MKQTKSPFKRRHFDPRIILLCVRRYCRYHLSYRDQEEMMRERGLSVDHTTVRRRVQRYAPEINRRMRPRLKMGGTSYRIDETYVKVGTAWKYLHRAVDPAGSTIEFMLGAKPDVSAAKRFFQEGDEGRPSSLAVHSRDGSARLTSAGLRVFSERGSPAP